VIDRLLALQALGVKLGLDGISRLLEALGHPECTFTCLHVAGTNGKGSVTAFVHEALVAAGVHAARYTSPHLTRLNERFVIGREPVGDDALAAAAARVLDHADRLLAGGALAAPPTFFEATTAIAFELFRRAGVEAAVVEVGLGGRFDATNVVAAPVGAITSIGLDHTEHLGHTLAAVAGEKAGIIKAGMTIVTGALPPEAAAVVARVAAARGARLVEAAAGARVRANAQAGRTWLEVETPEGTYGPLPLALRGAHQAGNALVAIRLLEAARAAGLSLPAAAVEQGLRDAAWPARLELLELGAGRRVLIDAAHNVDGAATLAAYLGRWHPERPGLVAGAMDDKDLDGMLRLLLPVTSGVVATAAALPRALRPAAVAARVRALDPGRFVEEAGRPAEALTRARERAPTVVVAGSIYVAGEARDAAVRLAGQQGRVLSS
jgi:dihydrofolate synthase/folylpolyglutamate synthase